MSVELKKLNAIPLRSIGLDEKWLQRKIYDDPSLLGLGDLAIMGRETRQPVGGKIDFLLHDAEEETFYEVEVMLGKLDESHIIRAIEYWDIERQRRPTFEHRAVIVAEQITTRFFNVLRLLNRSVPIIAIQLSAFRLEDGSVALHPITVLDVIEEIADPLEPEVPTDRDSWLEKPNQSPLSVADKILAALRRESAEPRITYNRYHLAIGTTGVNFMWLHERKQAGICYIEIRFDGEARDAAISELQELGIAAQPKALNVVGFRILESALDKVFDGFMKIIMKAEQASRE